MKGEVPPPPPVLRPTEVRRTLALVVDDLGLAAESIPPSAAQSGIFSTNRCAPATWWPLSAPAPAWERCSSSPPISACCTRRWIG